MGKAIDDEVLLALAKKGGGGGGGTDDYEDLSHKPQVNGHTLEGNKTTSDLGIKFADLPDAPTIPNDLADLQDDSSHRLVTDTEKATWDGKSDFSGAYADLTGLPTLGTASAKDVPATGDASSSQVVLGSDSRLTDSRPASDVPSWAKQSTKPSYTSNEVGAIATTQKGVASGVAELDANGKVPSSQLPSYVDDTIEGYLYNDKWYSDSQHTQEVAGESGKIYVELATNKTYRWSGSTFVEISESLALGETSSTAYRGDRGKTAYDHSQTTGNPHGTTASDVGLGNVPNVSTNDQEPTFTQASTRNNIASGEKLSVILGKIQKFFNDLKTVAFSGSFSDLSNKPENANTFQGTIAEWNQLTTAEKKAYDHASIPDSLDGNVTFPASKTMLSDGDSVEERISAKSIISGDIATLSYETNYTAPSDGYLVGVASAGNGNYVTLNIGGINMARAYSGGANLGGYACAFVKKGMVVYFSGLSSSSASARFIPLS